MLAVWPNLVLWARTGSAFYVPDFDALLYLVWSRDATRHGGWSLVDGVHSPSGPMMHPWSLFVPPALLARRFGFDLGATWRVFAGSGIALGLFAAIRPAVKRDGTALVLSAILLCDAGFLFGQVFQRGAQIAVSTASGRADVLEGVPRLLPHLRAPTPSWPVAILLVHLGATLHARERGGRRSKLLAGLSLGALFHSFFYFWTTAGLALVLAFALDRGRRRTYVEIAMIGGLIGAPAVVAGWRIKAGTPPDWLLRTDKFVRIGRFDDLLVPKILVAEWLLLALLVFRRGRPGLYAWCYTAAGLLLVDHQIVSRLEIENFHWTHAYGTAFSVLLATLFGPMLESLAERRRALRIAALAFAAAYVAGGFALRTLELDAGETRTIARIARNWNELDAILPPGSVVAGDVDTLFCAAARSDLRPLAGRLVEYSSATTDAELDERFILNWYLEGRSIEAARAGVPSALGLFGQDAQSRRDPEAGRCREAARLATIERVWADPTTPFRRYGVSHLLLPVGALPAPPFRDRTKKLTTHGNVWEIWEYVE